MWCSTSINFRSLAIFNFTNDIVNTSKITAFIFFADDTNLVFKDSKLNNLIFKINKELKNISNWFKLNKLSLKTNYIMLEKN